MLPFLNIDLIAKDELGGYTEINFAKAEAIYRERIARLLLEDRDFMLESNLAKDGEYSWMKKMQLRGYGLVLYYLCTDYPDDVHVKRVKARVKEGGHNVPENIVQHRYKMSLLYLKTNLHLFAYAYLIDNAETPQVMAMVQNGRVIRKEPNAPTWVKQSLTIVERLQRDG